MSPSAIGMVDIVVNSFVVLIAITCHDNISSTCCCCHYCCADASSDAGFCCPASTNESLATIL